MLKRSEVISHGFSPLNAAKVLNYADEVEHPPGGFHGGLWDEGYDVEYTFYGLGVLGLFEGRV